MTFNRAYAFFLLITVVGAFFTIKICTAAYSMYDYADQNLPSVQNPKTATQQMIDEQ